MSPLRSGAAWGTLAALALILAPAVCSAQAPPRFEVSGTVEPDVNGVRADLALRNTGGTAAASLKVQGQLGDDQQEVSTTDPVAPGATAGLSVHLSPRGLVPGVHVLPLLLDFAPAGRPDLATTQRAWLLVAFGEAAPPTVKLHLDDAQVDVRTRMTAHLSSDDGRLHTVFVRLLPPRGLSTPDRPLRVDVPASGGGTTASLWLLRGGAPRSSRQGVVAVAEWDEAGLHHAVATQAEVAVLPDPAVVPRVHTLLTAAAALLLGAAVGVELLRLWRS
jgi:hypothetical protein